jgi:hypothetical protein
VSAPAAEGEPGGLVVVAAAAAPVVRRAAGLLDVAALGADPGRDVVLGGSPQP